MTRYLLCSLIQILAFCAVALGTEFLWMFGKIPTTWYIVCLTCIEVVFAYSNGLAMKKYLKGV